MKLTPFTKKFVLHWGEMGTRWGINRTVAQVHALLFISPKPLNAEEIKAKYVFDMVYDPAETRLLKLAKERGAQIIPGIEMFVHQAARQFEIWTGKPAPWDEMLKVVLLALQDRATRNAPAK